MQENIIEELFIKLSQPNAVPRMLITENGINRLPYIQAIRDHAREYYHQIHHLALPTNDISLEEYFEEIAYTFRSSQTKENKIKRDIINLAHTSRDNIFILITDFENDLHLNDFAKFMRSILDQVDGKIKLITIGGEKLAELKTNMGDNSYFNYFEKVMIDKEYTINETTQNKFEHANTMSSGQDNKGVMNNGSHNTINNTTHNHYYSEEKS